MFLRTLDCFTHFLRRQRVRFLSVWLYNKFSFHFLFSHPMHPPTHLTSDSWGPYAISYWFLGIELESGGSNQSDIVLRWQIADQTILVHFPSLLYSQKETLILHRPGLFEHSVHLECMHFLCIEDVALTLTDHRMITIVIRPLV